MKLTRLLPFVAAATLLLPAGVAAAQETTPTCGEALSALVDARAALAAMDDTIPNPALPGLAEAVVKAKAALDAAEAAQARLKVADDLGATQAEIDRLEAAIVAAPDRETEIRFRIVAIQAVLDARAALAAAQEAQAVADDEVPNPALRSGPTFDAAVAAQNTADVACQGQPGDPGPVDDRDCADFETQADAQAVLDADDTDPNKLDANHDGTACEVDEGEDTVDLTIPGAADDTSQVSVLPQGGVDTGW